MPYSLPLWKHYLLGDDLINFQDILFKKFTLILITLFGLSLIFQLFMMRYGLALYDDGVLFYGAERVLDGDIPYKDFWFVYTPGNLFVFALIFKIMGPSIIIAKLFNTLICFLIVIVSYLLVKNITNGKLATILTIYLATLVVWIYGWYTNQNLPILFLLISSLYFLNYIKKDQVHYLVLSGILIGITALFRYDYGGYAFLAVSIILFSFKYQDITRSKKNLFDKFFYVLKQWCVLLGSTMTIIFPLIIYLLIMVPLQDIINQFIVYPTFIYPAYFNTPYPLPDSINTIITMFFPPFMFIITSVWIIYHRINGRRENWIVIFLFLLGLISMNSVRIMSISSHIYLAMIIAILLFIFFYSRYVRVNMIISGFKKLEKKDQILNIFFTFFTISFILLFTTFSINLCNDTLEKYTIPLNSEKGSGILINSYNEDFMETVTYLHENVPSNEKIYVGTACHDRMSSNIVMLYFLAERKSATKYSDMIPGVITTLPVQNEVITELKNNNVTYLILYDDKLTSSASKNLNKHWYESSGITVLDEYIKSNYKPVETIGRYTIYKLN